MGRRAVDVGRSRAGDGGWAGLRVVEATTRGTSHEGCAVGCIMGAGPLGALLSGGDMEGAAGLQLGRAS